MARGKRKFNWDELSSEEEELEVKKVPKKGKAEVKQIEQKEEKNVEDQANKLSKLSVKSAAPVVESSVRTSARSVRGSVKRELDFEDTASSKKAKTSSRSSTADSAVSVKEESPTASARSSRTVRDGRPPSVKEEKVSPKKATKKAGKANKDDESSAIESVENGDDLSTNMLVKRDKAAQSQEDGASQELQLPVINIRSIKMKMLKPQACKKKFNKQQLHSSPSPGKRKPFKFTEIKIDLSEEQRDWFNKQLLKYDGVYDEEFDVE